jgi:hypothetical protein
MAVTNGKKSFITWAAACSVVIKPAASDLIADERILATDP